MSTRSYIFMDRGEDVHPRYRGIYCQHDGYLECVGEHLRDYYNTEEKVKALIDMGAASSIYPTLEECNFYCRDGKEDLAIMEIDDKETLMKKFKASWAEYFYLFKDGKWMVYFPSRKIIPEYDFIELTEAFDRVAKYEKSQEE